MRQANETGRRDPGDGKFLENPGKLADLSMRSKIPVEHRINRTVFEAANFSWLKHRVQLLSRFRPELPESLWPDGGAPLSSVVWSGLARFDPSRARRHPGWSHHHDATSALHLAIGWLCRTAWSALYDMLFLA
jgi:hypothetical protein